MAAVVATAIQVTTEQTCVLIDLVVGHLHIVILIQIPFVGVPYQHGLVFVPTQRGNSQVLEVYFQTVFNVALSVGIVFTFLLTADDATLIRRIQPLLIGYVGIIAAAHELLEDIQASIHFVSVLALDGHTTHVATAIERADEACVILIVIWVAVVSAVKHNLRL